MIYFSRRAAGLADYLRDFLREAILDLRRPEHLRYVDDEEERREEEYLGGCDSQVLDPLPDPDVDDEVGWVARRPKS